MQENTLLFKLFCIRIILLTHSMFILLCYFLLYLVGKWLEDETCSAALSMNIWRWEYHEIVHQKISYFKTIFKIIVITKKIRGARMPMCIQITAKTFNHEWYANQWLYWRFEHWEHVLTITPSQPSQSYHLNSHTYKFNHKTHIRWQTYRLN